MTPEESSIETGSILAQHSAELRALSEGFRETNLKLDRVFSELHTLAQNLTILSSQPSFSVSDVLDNIIKIGTIFGFMVAGILYVMQAFISADITQLKSTDERITERLDGNRDRISRLEGIMIFKGAGIMNNSIVQNPDPKEPPK